MSWPRLDTRTSGPKTISSTRRTCARDGTSTRRCGRSGKATPSRELMSLRQCKDACKKKTGLWERQILVLCSYLGVFVVLVFWFFSSEVGSLYDS